MTTAHEVLEQLDQSTEVHFGGRLQPNGEFTYVIVKKGENAVALTPKQAASLAHQILQRINPSHVG